MTRQPPSSEIDLLNDWFRRVRESQFAHYEAAKKLAHANYYLGLPVVVLSAFSATSVFATLNSQPHLYFKILIGFIITLAAVLAGLQTFLRYPERAEKHRSVAARYGSVRRDIELLFATRSEPFDRERLNLLKEKIDDLSSESPEISPKIWRLTESILAERQDMAPEA